MSVFLKQSEYQMTVLPALLKNSVAVLMQSEDAWNEGTLLFPVLRYQRILPVVLDIELESIYAVPMISNWFPNKERKAWGIGFALLVVVIDIQAQVLRMGSYQRVRSISI